MTDTETRWAQRVREWRASGQSASEFSRGRGFEASTLRFWASRLKRSTATATAPEQTRLLRVTAAPAVGVLSVCVGEARIEVRSGFDRALLREVVEVLGGAR
jgi:hypothetical protein